MKVLSYKQRKQVIEFAKRNCKSNGFDHKYDHIDLTVKLSKYLAVKEKADVEVCETAAYLHDIAADKFRRKHGIVGAKQARRFLEKIGAPQDFVKQVAYSISQHNNGSPKKTIEAKILWDADKLQLVGPLGYTRIIRFCVLAKNMIDMFPLIQRSRKYEKFFFDRFYTITGRKLAKKIHGFMGRFHQISDGFKTMKIDNL
ncbi:MAG: hypothetical protein A2297_05375 [Elusimicrobia bacterium RIFOXYB2_FULL_48_7]|nr:MAG: hypothetical protein A2297_05375 [Elusimicrobia bacterium RIFOXYB2_FULL_48_7]